MKKRNQRRLAAAGLLCGLATLFTQNRGVPTVVGIALFLLWEWKIKKENWRDLLRAQACLFGPYLAITLATVAYFISKVGFERFFFSTVIFPLKYFPLWYWNTPQVYLTEVPVFPLVFELPALGIWFSIHLLLPLTYLLFFVRWWRVAKARPEEPWDRLMLLSLVGLFLFLGVAFSPSWLRLCSVSLPALILFVWFVKSSGRFSSAITNLLWVVGAVVLVGQSVIAQTNWRAYLATPAGRVAFLEPELYEKFRWLRDRTRPGDFIFQASNCNLYYLLGLQNPTPVSFVTATGYTRPEQVQERGRSTRTVPGAICGVGSMARHAPLRTRNAVRPRSSCSHPGLSSRPLSPRAKLWRPRLRTGLATQPLIGARSSHGTVVVPWALPGHDEATA